ncbi:DUF4376 domain-containing protein [Mannheimia haemolytica]|uniref:DUF4376 domain-containing protein n=1 Tax=Mannheimia haemolytica TaxID=75985 RepID=UPI00201BD79C|nr:DUF4376 domain-containing protein [Mannheimia haemolytica]UQX70124.1 DUF4376 domain-containing protein [Mannheimia haemolytica]UQX70254.1 DUF4376 domain-containing protein [Mannheimia haemolytica]
MTYYFDPNLATLLVDQLDDITPDALPISNDEAKKLLDGVKSGGVLYVKNNIVQVTPPRPSKVHEWDGETWILNTEQQAVKKAEEIAKMREQINALRDNKINGGVYVEAVGKWIDTDATAERNILSVKASFDLFGDAVGEIAWTCADNSLLMIDKTKLMAIWQALMTAKTGNHANALKHKAAVELAENPLEYDYSSGWTQSYEDYLEEQANV